MDRRHTLEHDGRTRHFRVHLPPRWRPRESLAMVMVFHGGGGSIDGMVETTQMDRTADEKRFVGVYPAGTGRRADRFLTWNAGACCGSAMDENVDDVGFVAGLIDFMVRRYDIDPRRVYATGISNGAQMSYRLACELADKVAAIAPVASQNVLGECRPSRPVPVLHFHGTADPCALYGGGECGGCFADFFRDFGIPLPRRTWSCGPVPEAVRRQAEINRCSGETRVTLEQGDARCETYRGCAEDAEVTLCTIRGGGHTWPGGEVGIDACRRRPEGSLCRRWRERVGVISRDVSANEAMWEFFGRHPLPPGGG